MSEELTSILVSQIEVNVWVFRNRNIVRVTELCHYTLECQICESCECDGWINQDYVWKMNLIDSTFIFFSIMFKIGRTISSVKFVNDWENVVQFFCFKYFVQLCVQGTLIGNLKNVFCQSYTGSLRATWLREGGGILFSIRCSQFVSGNLTIQTQCDDCLFAHFLWPISGKLDNPHNPLQNSSYNMFVKSRKSFTLFFFSFFFLFLFSIGLPKTDEEIWRKLHWNLGFQFSQSFNSNNLLFISSTCMSLVKQSSNKLLTGSQVSLVSWIFMRKSIYFWSLSFSRSHVTSVQRGCPPPCIISINYNVFVTKVYKTFLDF